MTNSCKLVPRPHHRLVTKIEALFLGQLETQNATHSASINIHALVNEWLLVANFCFLLAFCLNFILNY